MHIVSLHFYAFCLLVVLVKFCQYLPSDWLERLLLRKPNYGKGIVSARLVGWLGFNGTFSTNRLYCAMIVSAKPRPKSVYDFLV